MVRLDWEIESEQQVVRQTGGEDPESRRRRRRRQLILLMLPLVLVGLVALVVGVVIFRLRQVEAETVQVLRDTVDAEVATLRIGDEQAFLGFQRSANDTWLSAQQEAFNRYQDLKLNDQIQLTGQILDAAVDGHRARVQVQEILDGAPYVQTWFYWRYDDGWRHVPPDYTFWGDAATLETDRLTIRYQRVDEALAHTMRDALAGWLQTACASLGCADLPMVTVEIVPDPGLASGWSAEDAWLLRVRSPYTQAARQDMPFDFALQFELANLLAERLVGVTAGGMQPVYPADAFYLLSSVDSWLVGRFVSINTNSFLVDSVARNYGEEAVGGLLRAMQPDSSAAVLNSILGTQSLAQANLDWRDFLTWRLTLEDELIQRGDENNFLALYDTRDESIRNQAYQRYNAGPAGENRVVVSVTPETTPEGIYQLRALVEVGDPATRQEEVLFRLVDERWLRAN